MSRYYFHVASDWTLGYVRRSGERVECASFDGPTVSSGEELRTFDDREAQHLVDYFHRTGRTVSKVQV
jgi:hypothetical protein